MSWLATSLMRCWSAASARGTVARIRSSAARRLRNVFLFLRSVCCLWTLSWTGFLVWQQCDQRAQAKYDSAEPDPHDQRVVVDLDIRSFPVGCSARKDHVDVFLQRRPDGNFRRGLLFSRFIAAAFRTHCGDFHAILEKADGRLHALIVRSILDAELVHAERVLADRNSVANAGLRRYICRKSMAGPTDKPQDETKEHNIAAVSTRVLQR